MKKLRAHITTISLQLLAACSFGQAFPEGTTFSDVEIKEQILDRDVSDTTYPVAFSEDDHLAVFYDYKKLRTYIRDNTTNLTIECPDQMPAGINTYYPLISKNGKYFAIVSQDSNVRPRKQQLHIMDLENDKTHEFELGYVPFLWTEFDELITQNPLDFSLVKITGLDQESPTLLSLAEHPEIGPVQLSFPYEDSYITQHYPSGFSSPLIQLAKVNYQDGKVTLATKYELNTNPAPFNFYRPSPDGKHWAVIRKVEEQFVCVIVDDPNQQVEGEVIAKGKTGMEIVAWNHDGSELYLGIYDDLTGRHKPFEQLKVIIISKE